MAKVTIQEVVDAGFREEQFGTPDDFATPDTGYLARIIEDAGVWASAAVGEAAYTAATSGIALLRLRRAELCYVKADLWRRRAAFLDGNAQSALERGEYLERRGYLEQAERADACADHWRRQFITDGRDAEGGTGASMGHVASGPFRSSSGVVA